MLFRRKSKAGAQGRAARGKAAGAGKASTRATGKPKAKSADTGKRGKAAPTGKQTKAGKQAKAGTPAAGASQQQSRTEAEAQIKRMMSDGSLDKVKTLLQARNPQDVADEYPQQTVDAIRNWLHDRDQ